MPIFPWLPIPDEVVMIIVIIVIIVIAVIIVLLYALGKVVEKALDYRTGRMIVSTLLLLFSPFVAISNYFIPLIGVLFIAVGVACIGEGIRWATPLYVGIIWIISVYLYDMILVSLGGGIGFDLFFQVALIFWILGWISILVGLPLCIGMGAYTLHKRSKQDATVPTPTVSPKPKSESTAKLGNCPKCSKAVKPDWGHCTECGTPLD